VYVRVVLGSSFICYAFLVDAHGPSVMMCYHVTLRNVCVQSIPSVDKENDQSFPIHSYRTRGTSLSTTRHCVCSLNSRHPPLLRQSPSKEVLLSVIRTHAELHTSHPFCSLVHHLVYGRLRHSHCRTQHTCFRINVSFRRSSHFFRALPSACYLGSLYVLSYAKGQSLSLV
jgi:hypothetical protein